MNKIIEFFKKNIIEIGLVIITFVLVLSYSLTIEISDLDEIWNYNIPNQIANGLHPYTEINILTTPFFYIVSGIILKLTYNSLIIMKVVNAIMSSLIVLFSYKILYKTTSEKTFSFIAMLVIIKTYFEFFRADYNFMYLLLVLILINNKLGKLSIKKEIFNGILIGLLILTKHTLGIVFLIFEIINWIIKKKNPKFNLIGIGIPISIFIVYLISFNGTNDFVNYVIKGVKEFDNKVPFKQLLKSSNKITNMTMFFTVFYFTTIFAIILEKIRKENTNLIRTTKIILLNSLTTLLFIYPIADKIHLHLSIYIGMLLLMYYSVSLIKFVLSKIEFEIFKKVVLPTLSTFLIFLLIIPMIISLKNNVQKYLLLDKEDIKQYSNLYLPEYIRKRINKIKEYSNKKIIIADAEAAVYNIPNNIYNKDFDLMLKGNLGENGPERLINQIKESKDTYYVIKATNQELNWQMPKNIVEYIRENLKKVDQYDIFEVYYKGE